MRKKIKNFTLTILGLILILLCFLDLFLYFKNPDMTQLRFIITYPYINFGIPMLALLSYYVFKKIK